MLSARRRAAMTANYALIGTAAVVAVIALSMWNSLFGVLTAGAFVLFVAIVAVSTRPEMLPKIAYLTVVLGFFDTLGVRGVANVRVYQVLSLLLLAALLIPNPDARRGTGPLVKWLVVFTAACVVSALWTISLADTLAIAFGQAYLLYLFLIVVYLLNRGYITVHGVLTAIWVGALLSSTVAMFQFVAGLAGLDFHLQYVVGLPWGRPGGLMSEPDWAALVAAIGFLIALHRPAKSRYKALSIAVFILVVGVTLVRAVIIALTIALFLMVASKYGEVARKAVAVGFPIVVIVALFVTAYSPGTFERLSVDVFSNSARDGGALDSRTGVIELVLDRADAAPWTGHGAGTLAHETQLEHNALRYVGGGTLNAGRGSTNILITSFWDLGIPGLVVMSMLLLTWLISAWRIRDEQPALYLVTVLLIVDFQVNNGFRFGFVWIVMALVSWSVLQQRRRRQAATSVSLRRLVTREALTRPGSDRGSAAGRHFGGVRGR